MVRYLFIHLQNVARNEHPTGQYKLRASSPTPMLPLLTSRPCLLGALSPLLLQLIHNCTNSPLLTALFRPTCARFGSILWSTCPSSPVPPHSREFRPPTILFCPLYLLNLEQLSNVQHIFEAIVSLVKPGGWFAARGYRLS